jgi:predicted secreted protein
MKIILTCLGFIFSLPLFAGEAAQLHVIGFSEAGNYLAFQQYGITDGEGLAFANTYFVDVEANKYAANPVETRGEPDKTKEKDETTKEDETTEEDETTQESMPIDSVRKDNLKQAESQLKTLKIIKDNRGEQVISHLLYDVGVEPLTVQFAVGTPLRGGSYKTYTLKLEERKGEAECFEVGEAKMLTLTLINDKGEGEKKTKSLQEDKSIPKSRGCPLRYRIQDVYLYHEEFIVVFLNVFKPGFEGESMRYLVITGTVN